MKKVDFWGGVPYIYIYINGANAGGQVEDRQQVYTIHCRQVKCCVLGKSPDSTEVGWPQFRPPDSFLGTRNGWEWVQYAIV